jgi:hypothetical protein
MTSRYPGGLIRKNAANTAITGASGVWDLSSQAQAVKNNTWPISGLALPVSGSLRFRASNSAYLNRTMTTATNNLKWTWSAWVKRGTLGTTNILFNAGDGSSDNFGAIQFRSEDTLQFSQINGGAYNVQVYTTAVFRDPSAWYHVVLVYDSPNATSTDRVQIYVNGTRQTALTYATGPFAQNTASKINSAITHYISKLDYASLYFDGCMAEVNFIDGQALTPASFGQTSPITGVWEPIKYTGTYGTNGFYLSLSDTSSIGKDFSGNGNNWTPNNISTTSGLTFDLMRDVPTQWAPQSVTDVGGVVRGNYCTLNPIKRGTTYNPILSNGNLTYTAESSAAQNPASSTMGVSTGSWYYEATITNSGYNPAVGVHDPSNNFGTGDNWRSAGMKGVVLFGSFGGEQYVNGSYTASTGYSFTTGDIMGIAFDASSGKVWVAKNNTWFNSGNPSAGTGQVGTASSYSSLAPIVDGTNNSGNKDTINVNFGQRPFAYTPPTGFKSLCTTNLSTPTIGATTATAANKYFDATLITGTAATQVITNAGGFQPDFVWLKSRTNANNPTIYDAIRGVNTVLYPALTNAEVVGSAQLTAFNSNGFTLGASENANDDSGEASVGWQWNAGGSTVTNTSGSISSQVRANPTAGFSIATWTGQTSGSATIGHGLGVAPSVVLVKGRNDPGQWWMYHSAMGNTKYIWLNNTGGSQTGSGTNAFADTAPTSTVFTVGTSFASSSPIVNWVAYCWTPIAGYSAFGSYTGNGSADGPFVFTGFRPRFVVVKRTDSADSWYVYDTARNTFNVMNKLIQLESSNSENEFNTIDSLSNGFKFRTSNSAFNGSGATYIYMAFAEHPFKYSLAR